MGKHKDSTIGEHPPDVAYTAGWDAAMQSVKADRLTLLAHIAAVLLFIGAIAALWMAS